MEHSGVQAVGRSTVLPRVRVGAATLVGLVVGVSAVVRIVAGTAKSTPNYFVDEYRFFEIARSLVQTGRPFVRGADTHYPALLEPLLTAPA